MRSMHKNQKEKTGSRLRQDAGFLLDLMIQV